MPAPGVWHRVRALPDARPIIVVTPADESPDISPQAEALVGIGHEFHARGWVPATSGNFSARVDSTRIAITVSGRHKGRLAPDDIMLADLDGNSLSPGKRPSAVKKWLTSLRWKTVGC